jgi:ML domain
MHRLVSRIPTVLALALVGLVVVPGAASATSVPFTLCSTGADHLTIRSVDITPYPVAKGKTETITISGALDETVTSGTYTAAVSYLGIQISSTTGALSDLAPTPWSVGPITLKSSGVVPSTAPSGAYTLQFSGVDGNGQLLTCAQINFSV